MDIQRLRNLTTGRLHTEMGHIYEDIEHITRMPGIMTHQLPNACRALEPWLKHVAPDERLWDGEWDQTHVGDFAVPAMTDEEQKEFMDRYAALPSLLAGKNVIGVVV